MQSQQAVSAAKFGAALAPTVVTPEATPGLSMGAAAGETRGRSAAVSQQGAACGTPQRGGMLAAGAAATVTDTQPRAPAGVKKQHHNRKHSNGIVKRLFCPWAVEGGGRCESFLLTKADDEPQHGCEPGQVSLMCPPRRMLGDTQAAAKQRSS